MIIRVVLIALLIQSISSQPRCSSDGIPSKLPALETEDVVLDLSRFISGPNLTLSLNSTSPLITLRPKYKSIQQKHNLNAILEINNANGIVSMLGVSSVNRFYIYYAPVNDPNRLSVKQIPPTLERCSNHAISPDARSVAITCENANRTKFIVAYSKLNDVDPWQVYVTGKYAASNTRQIEYLSNKYLAVIVKHPYNSYIEVWDSEYGRIIGVYDRTFLALKFLNIVDIQMTAGNLFILDYDTGIYELTFSFNTFYILRQFQFTYYSKMAVYINSIVLSKKGSITEFSGSNAFKYETVGQEVINELIISDEYIVVYTVSQVIVYLRGYHSPYFTIPTSNYLIWGTFISTSQIIQTISLEHTTEITIQQIFLTHPYLKIPENALNRTEVTISAVSRLDDIEEHCSLSFTIVRTEEAKMEIFDDQMSRNRTEHIYMNRPGRAEIDLTEYGMGPNLFYSVEKFGENVNLTTEVRKVKSIENIQIEGLDKFRVKATYFSDTCGLYQNQCPLAIDTYTLGMMRFYMCSIQTDFYDMANRITCAERYKQIKAYEYTHYQLEQSPNQLQRFYEISVGNSSQNEISIRIFKITPQSFMPISAKRIRINGTNSYGENNITQLEFDEENKIIFALMPRKKEIEIFRITETSQDIMYESIMKINSEALFGKYFAPSQFSLDSDGGLWVKSIDQIFVFDFRQPDRIDKPIILSIVEISLKQAKSYGYDFEVVEQFRAPQVFQPQPGLQAQIKSTREQNRKFLIIYNENDTLLMCPVSHLYQIDSSELQPLPRYGYHVPQEKSQRIIQSLGNSQVFVTLFAFGEMKVSMIYNLDSLSLASAYYTSIETKNTAMPAYFYLSSSNPLVMFLQAFANSSLAKAYQISDKPKVLFILNQMLGQKQAQQLILKVYNEHSQIRHSVLLGISNTPENMTKGLKYPYPNLKAYAIDIYIQADTVGWVSGNVLKISYACNDCEKPEDPDDPYIDVKGKLWVKSDLMLPGGHQFEVISNRGTDVAIMRNNMIYILDSSNNQIQGLHQLTETATDSIIVFKVNFEHRLIAAAVKTENSLITIVIYTITNYKGFSSSRMALPSTVHYVLNMDYKGNVIAVVDFNNVYIVSVDNYGNCYLVDYVNEGEAGGAVCWTELLDPLDGVYTLILTLCESGITTISFKLEENYSVLTIINKQTLDLKESLNNFNIRMPTDSSFLRTLTTRAKNGTELNLLVVVRNFNCFEWVLTLRNKLIISEARISRVIHRYGDFGATQDVSFEENGRFMLLTYFGVIQKNYQYIHAIYDFNDTHATSKDEPYKNCYIMQTLQAQVNKRPQFAFNRTLLVLSDDANHLRTIDVHNKFRAVIHNYDKLESQSLFMIPFSPVSSINIEIYIKGIDVVVWEIWEILLIVLLGVILLVIVGYLFRIFLTKYKQNKKLIPLLVDYAEYEEDLAEEIEERKRASMHEHEKEDRNKASKNMQVLERMEEEDDEEKQKKQEEEKIGNINVSERGSVNI